MGKPLAIRRVTARVYRYPLTIPVTTSFGTMRDRPMLLVEVEDADGATGLGEVWCNFPAVGAGHRARLIDSMLAPLLTQRSFADPAEAFQHLTDATEVLALQSAEPGPFAQAIAGLDIAMWDMAARKAGQPLWRFLNPSAAPSVGVYASGLNPQNPEYLAATKLAEGYTAFKLKVGFGLDRDLENLRAMREVIGTSHQLMVDANQAWTLAAASHAVPHFEPFDLAWLEEPLRCDRPNAEWLALANLTAIPLAAGENISGADAFAATVNAGALTVVQPDLAKWGGFSGCLPVARAVQTAGKRFCPHYLGGGVGLLASAHLLAAAGGNGLLEIDANPNPLRTLLCGPLNAVDNGTATLGNEPGLAASFDLDALAEFEVAW